MPVLLGEESGEPWIATSPQTHLLLKLLAVSDDIKEMVIDRLSCENGVYAEIEEDLLQQFGGIKCLLHRGG